MALAHTDLYLPMFVSGRDFAEKMADRLGDVSGRSLIVDATDLRSGTSSFAAHLVQRLLVDGKADELIVVGAPPEFDGYLDNAARADGVSDRLALSRQFPLAVR